MCIRDSSSTEPSVDVVWADVAGTYNVSLTVNLAPNCIVTYESTVEVVPAAIANAGADLVNCVDGNIQLDGTASQGVEYSWVVISGDFGSIDGGATTLTPAVSPTETTVYELTVTDLANGCEDTDQVTVTVDSDLNPTAIADAGYVTCYTNEVTLDGSGTLAPVGDQDAVLTYLWLSLIHI